MFGYGKKRFGDPVGIGFMCLCVASCGSLREEETGVRLPADIHAFRTNGMEEHLARTRAARGRVFLEKNATKPGVVERPSGLQFVVLKEGTGPFPRTGESVMTHYKLFTTKGHLIDDSRASGPPQLFELDKVIAGWREALQEMRVGATWRLFLPPELAYGRYGLAHIPGGETLVYELTLLDIHAKSAAGPVVLPARSVGRTPGKGEILPLGRGEKIPAGGLVRDNLDLLD